ncbi:MAG: glycosyltransferase family 39 protein [Candidatus Omnitrophota bacterium]
MQDYLTTSIFPFALNSDSQEFFRWAKDIVYGDFLNHKAFMKWPLYPYILAGIFKISGIKLSVVYYLQFIIGVLSSVLVYFISKEFFNKEASFLAGLLTATYGLFIFFESLAVYTTISILLNLIILFIFIKTKDDLNGLKLFWIGVLSGIATILQGNIIIFASCACLWLLIINKNKLHIIIFRFISFIIGALFIISLTVIHNYLVEKDFVLIQGNAGINFYIGNNHNANGIFYCPDEFSASQEGIFRNARIIASYNVGRQLKTSEVSFYWFKRGIVSICREPFRHLLLIIKKLGLVFSPYEYTNEVEFYILRENVDILKYLPSNLIFIFPFIITGVLFGIKNFKKLALLYIFLVSIAISITIFFITSRYRIIITPIFIIFASYGLTNWIYVIKKKKYFIVFTCLLLLAYGLLFCDSSWYKKSLIQSDDFESYMFIASRLYNDGQYYNAFIELRKALMIRPDNQRALFLAGELSFYLRNLKEANKYWLRLIEINPLASEAYYSLGFIYNEQFRFKDAVVMFQKTLSLDPENKLAYYQLGLAYKGLDKKEEAKNVFTIGLTKLNASDRLKQEIIKKELELLRK